MDAYAICIPIYPPGRLALLTMAHIMSTWDTPRHAAVFVPTLRSLLG